jgi:type IV pilus assembly protein PilO
VKQEFFIEQPISIDATGDYHSFGSFVSSLAALPRIVTLHDFTITGTPSQSQI